MPKKDHIMAREDTLSRTEKSNCPENNLSWYGMLCYPTLYLCYERGCHPFELARI